MAKSIRKTEDYLPKVLVAGQPNDCVPRIIICDGTQKKTRASADLNASLQYRVKSKSQPPTCCPPRPSYPQAPSRSPRSSCPPAPSCPPPPPCPPPIKPNKRKMSECCPPQPPPSPPKQPSNFDESSACSKLMLRMQSLKEEMNAMARQNEKIQQQLKGGHAVQKCRERQSAPCARPVTMPKEVEGRFREYSKHTGLLEKQVETMEQSVRRLNQQFMEAEQKQKEMEKARIHAQKMTETLACQKLEREPKLKCRDYCKGGCAKQYVSFQVSCSS